MNRCEICGHEYDKPLEIVVNGSRIISIALNALSTALLRNATIADARLSGTVSKQPAIFIAAPIVLTKKA